MPFIKNTVDFKIMSVLFVKVMCTTSLQNQGFLTEVRVSSMPLETELESNA